MTRDDKRCVRLRSRYISMVFGDFPLSLELVVLYVLCYCSELI